MRVGLLKFVNGSLFCLKCGILNRPSSSTSRNFCTLKNFTRNVTIQSSLLSNRVFKRILVNRRASVNIVKKSRESISYSQIKWSDIKFMFSLAWRHKGRISAGFSLLIISSGVFLTLPKLLGKFLDESANVNRDDFSYKFAKYFKENPIMFALFLLIGGIAMSLRIYLVVTAGQLIINDLRLKVYNSLMRNDMTFFDRKINSVGELNSRLLSDVAIVGQTIIGIVGAGGMMFYTSPQLCYIGLVIGPGLIGIMAISAILSKRIQRQMQDSIAEATKLSMESNIKTVKMLVTENKEINTYRERINNIWLVSKRDGLMRGIVAGTFQTLVYGTLTGMFFYGGQLISQGVMTFGDLSSFLLYAVICIYNVGVLQEFNMEFARGLGAASRLIELANEKPLIPLTGGIKIYHVDREISFQSVAFAYPENPPLFNDVTFKIPAGKVTAIVGPSGSGKSTIANLLLRLYDPIQGSIMIDGQNLKDLDLTQWRRLIGTVSQEPVLFTTSIKNNIAYAAEKPELITEEQIENAAIQANCIDFIRDKPDRFDTLVGEFGSTGLSGGEKQRIAIARAWLMNPRVLIMDEATSALDAESEYNIRLALRAFLNRHQQTVIIIAHRLSTIQHADQIVVLDKGRVAEIGTYNKLTSNKDGIFRKLVDKQAIGWCEDKF